ncbi:MAG: YtxH domain-containing protein [Candidatus Dormiibacterota bacterium]|jgi:gas vesicle protein
MGYIRGFVHGAAVGAVIGICFAPQQGERTRAQLVAFGRAAREGVDTAQRTAKHVAPVFAGAASLAREQVVRRRHHEETAPAFPGTTDNGHQ